MIFEKVTPEMVGIHSEGILAFLDSMEKRGLETHSMMLIRRGKICAEGWWKPYNPDSPHMMFSFTKALTSTAIGFACNEGKLALSDRICDIFPDKLPENPNENLLSCTIYDLLTMTCGQKTELDTSDTQNPHWIEDFFSLEFKYKPGTCFMYNTAGTNLLCAALKRRTGENLTEYLTPRLFSPLGIENIECFCLPDGTEAGGAGSRLKTEDMARFILFVSQNGRWDKKQLLSSDWFKTATGKLTQTVSPAFDSGDPDWRQGYGFQFWRCVPENVFRADGAFGQYGIVFEDKDAILILQSASSHQQEQLTCVWEELLPAITDKEVLPESPASRILKQRLENAEITPVLSARNSWSENRINGKKFRFDESVPGMVDFIGGVWMVPPQGDTTKTLRFEFAKEKAELIFEQTGGEFTATIGLQSHFKDFTLDGRTYGAVGRWRSENRFEAEIRCAESVAGRRFIFTFTDDALTVESESTLPLSGGIADRPYQRYILKKSE